MLRKIMLLPVFLAVLVVLAIIAVVAISKTLDDDDLAQCKAIDNSQCQVADAIVVVSGGDTTARTNRGVDLLQAGWAKKIILSGASADPNSISNAEAMRQLAVSRGIDDEQILIDEDSKNTKENARNSVKLLNKIGAKNVILVSSPYHLRRVKMNFVAVDSSIFYRTAAAKDAAWDWWFVKPSGWQIAVTEIAGLAELKAEIK